MEIIPQGRPNAAAAPHNKQSKVDTESEGSSLATASVVSSDLPNIRRGEHEGGEGEEYKGWWFRNLTEKLRLELLQNVSRNFSHVFFGATTGGMGVFYPNDGTPGNMDDDIWWPNFCLPFSQKSLKSFKTPSFPFWNSIFSPCFRCSMWRQSRTHASTKHQPTNTQSVFSAFLWLFVLFVAAIELGVGTNINVWHEQRLWNFVGGLPVRQDGH